MSIQCINTRLLSRGPLRVRVLRVDNPTLIWVQLENSREDLEELIESLTLRMNRRSHVLHCSPDDIKPDELVAIREGRKWQRGIINQIGRHNLVTIFLRDWGRTIQRPMSDCYILEDRFHDVTWKAIPCGLAYIKPLGTDILWSDRVNLLTRILVEGREGYIQILGTHTEESAAITLRSVRSSEDEIIDLKELLIRMGCAQHSDRMMLGLPNSDQPGEDEQRVSSSG